MDDEKILINIYKVLNRPYNNLIKDTQKIFKNGIIMDITRNEQKVLFYYISGLYKEIIDYNIIPTIYENYLIYTFPLEIKNGNINPKSRYEFEETLNNE